MKFLKYYYGFIIKRIIESFKVAICSIILIAFLFNTISFDLAYASVGANNYSPLRENQIRGIVPVIIPEYLGSIKDSWISKDQSEKIVIHIQDAHCNYSAQHKIKEIIEYLNKEYGINTVNLEGGSKGYDLSIFTDIKDKVTRDKVSDYFVKEGLINGGEYYAINNPGKVKLWGIEDTKLYVDNLSIYRNSLKHKEEVDKALKSLSYILSNLKLKVYSKELLDFDMKYNAYKAGNIEFKEHLEYLMRWGQSPSLKDDHSGTVPNSQNTPNINLLNQALIKEGNIDFKKADKERDAIIDNLYKKLPRKIIEDLVLKTVEFKSERISQKEFYDYIITQAQKCGLDISLFPDLNKYIHYISVYDSIDKIKLSEEIEAISDNIKASLFRSDKEKELSFLSKNLIILKAIFNISITKEDYEYYIKNKEDFNVDKYIKFITDVGAYCNTPLRGVAQINGNSPIFRNLDQYRDEILKFYEYSFKRDNAFMGNMKFANVSTNSHSPLQEITILITGGFHTENLTELFKKREYILYINFSQL